jgi:hypothetical protein
MKYCGLAILCLGLLAGWSLYQAEEKKEEKDKPKTIKEIMKTAHKEDGLRDEVVGGKADAAQKKELLALYVDLSKNDPPKGDKADWKKRTDAIVKAAKGVVAGDSDAIADLKKATNCKGCHELHRPAKEKN